MLVSALALPKGGSAQLAARPKLVVFLTVDQLRADYLDRWARQLTGGLGRLSQRGAFFTNAYQDHAIAETAPGHASPLSGRFPRSTGIVRNAAGVEDPQAPLLTSRDPGASPYRFRGSSLIDRMRSGSPYDDDAHVPLIFYGSGIRLARIAERALAVDAAPTLAYVIGVTPYERLDGRVLVRALADGNPR